MRRDLVVTALPDGFTVKDPSALDYFRLNPREFTILQALDGRCTAATLRATLRRSFPDTQMTTAALTQFLNRLMSAGLVFSTRPGTAERRLDLESRARQRRRWTAVFSLLSISMRGFHPGPVLRATAGITRLMLSPLCLLLLCGILLAGAAIATIHFEQIVARLPTLMQLTTTGNILWLTVAWIVIKLLHELGHAAVCQHFGGECPDVGIILLVLMPLFYCDVSDAWMFRSRWQRLAVSAAGIGVELLLAAVFTLLWWISEPGWLHAMFLNGMVLCSLNTVLFNAISGTWQVAHPIA